MHRIPLSTGVLALVLAGASACAGESPLPAPVAAELAMQADLCREVEGKADVGEAVSRADLNADGITDYVVDVAGITCEGAWSVYGDRDKAVSVFVGARGNGATQAFGDSVYGVRLAIEGRVAKLWLTVAGVACGKAPARDFASEQFCERPLVWRPAERRFEYAPVSAVRMIR